MNAHREIHDYANRLSYRVVEEEGAGLGPVTHTTRMLFLGINGEAYSQTRLSKTEVDYPKILDIRGDHTALFF